MFGGLIAKLGLSLVFGRVKDALGIVPRWLWLTLLVVTIAVCAALVHQRYSNAAIEAAYSKGRSDADAEWVSEIQASHEDALNWKLRFETASDLLTESERKRHEADLRATAYRADALRLSGPGASATRCRPGDNSGIPSVSNEQEHPSAQPDDTGPGMLAADRFSIVPWAWLVQRAEEHDQLLSEVESLRRWHTEQEELRATATRELEVEN